jgi:hypothetical protein
VNNYLGVVHIERERTRRRKPMSTRAGEKKNTEYRKNEREIPIEER